MWATGLYLFIKKKNQNQTPKLGGEDFLSGAFGHLLVGYVSRLLIIYFTFVLSKMKYSETKMKQSKIRVSVEK